jgi:hypothetical protein
VDYVSNQPQTTVAPTPSAVFVAGLVFVLTGLCSHSPRRTLRCIHINLPTSVTTGYPVQTFGFFSRDHDPFKPPRTQCLGTTRRQVVDLLDELCHAQYDSFLCAHVDNQAPNIRCEYSNAESVPMRLQPPRKALLTALEGYIDRHESLRRTGILHRDILFNNLMINKYDNNPSRY